MYIIYIKLYVASLSPSLSVNFILDIVLFDRQSVRPFIVPFFSCFCFVRKKNSSLEFETLRLFSSDSYFFSVISVDSSPARRNHGDLIACFPSFTTALFKFLRFLPYNRMPKPRLFCANDEDAEYTILSKSLPSLVYHEIFEYLF